MRVSSFLLVIVLLSPSLSGSPPGAEEFDVPIASLLEEMVDLRGLARLPDPPFRARQASSYDPRSKSPDDPKGWFANRDAGNYLRVEEAEDGGKRYVLLEAEGPGAVVRIWSANPKGVLRIHIDGEEALKAPMGDLLQGRHESFPSPFGYNASRGCNLYFPFPYQKSCKITSDEGGFYYQVGYRTYPEGTKVEPFRLSRLEGIRSVLEKVAGILQEPARAMEPRQGAATVSLGLHVGKTTRVTPPAGGGAAHTLVLRLGGRDAESLRRTVLSIRFDGVETVRTPLGDFFGTGPGANAYDSLPFQVAQDGTFTSRWPMPFREVMEIAIDGPGTEPIEGSVVVEPFPWDDRTLLFHAVWRGEYDIPTKEFRDWNYVTVAGAGVYVGNLLNVGNPVRNWWGEGDEKIYIDGETFPSHFGTGTEDYYGYAWCCPEPFVRPYHGQTRCDGPGNYGHTSVHRWHILDAIPFQEDLRFDMEVWHHRRDTRVSFETGSYYYALPGARDTNPPLEAKDLEIPEIPELKVMVIPGAIEGEGLERTVTGGQAEPQDLGSFGMDRWSRDSHLWWRGAKPGDRMEVTFPAPKAGRWRVILHLTKAPDYGIHKISVGGSEDGQTVDLWGPAVKPAGPIDFGVHDLSTTGNLLAVEVVGTNEKANPKNYMFGLDCIVLKEANGGR